MKKIFSMANKCTLFNNIDEAELDSLLNCLGVKTQIYERNEAIMSVGDNVPYIGLILDGTAIVSKDDFWGNRTILSEVNAGQIFGEAYAASGRTLAVNVTAKTCCSVMLLDIRKILTVCPSACSFHSRLIGNFVMLCSEKNVLLSEKIGYISQRRLRDKILCYLSDCSAKEARKSFTIPYNRQQLADYLCTDRSALSAELCRLRDEGIISFSKNFFTLNESCD